MVRTRAHSVGKKEARQLKKDDDSLGYLEKKTYICSVKNNYFILV